MANLIIKDLSLSVKHPFLKKSKLFEPHPELKILKNISLEVLEGDRVAIIGNNGAGKTTLLRAMAGIFQPSEGSIEISGRVSMLLNSGLGVDLEKSAIENIFAYGIMKNYSRKSIAGRIESIEDFTGLRNFMETPLRFFSQGMLARLVFTLATEWPAEVLVMDEGIGMADYEFHRKATTRLEGYLSSASILILASHSEQLLRNYCNRAILLDKGELILQGTLDEALEIHYRGELSE